MTAAEVRIPRARLLVVVAAALFAATIVWLTRGYNFYFDEWEYILNSPDWTWTTYLQPHNVHPAMLHRLVYTTLLSTVGMRSYVPYMAVLLALHAASVVLLFEIVRRRAGDLVGIAAAALLLVLGAGWEDLLWAFQIMFVGSVACGLGMLLALQAPRPRMWLAALLLLCSLMFSAIGLFFGIAAGTWLFLSPERRRDVIWLAPIALVAAVWYVAYGRSGASTNPPPSAGNIALLPGYALWGLGASAAGLIGEGGLFGPVLLLLAAAAIAIEWRRHRADAFALGMAAGLLTFYLVTGLSRAQLGFEQAAAGRYLYVGAVFWLMLLADAARRLPWRGTWRPALAAGLFLACFSSGVLLYAYGVAKEQQMLREAADLQALAAVRADPCLDPNGAVDPLVMPQVSNPALYYRAVDRYGDPLGGRPAPSGPAFDRARANLLIPGCK